MLYVTGMAPMMRWSNGGLIGGKHFPGACPRPYLLVCNSWCTPATCWSVRHEPLAARVATAMLFPAVPSRNTATVMPKAPIVPLNVTASTGQRHPALGAVLASDPAERSHLRLVAREWAGEVMAQLALASESGLEPEVAQRLMGTLAPAIAELCTAVEQNEVRALCGWLQDCALMQRTVLWQRARASGKPVRRINPVNWLAEYLFRHNPAAGVQPCVHGEGPCVPACSLALCAPRLTSVAVP